MRSKLLILAICSLLIIALGLPSQAAIITNPELTSVSDTTMIITWSTTDEASTTEILWGVSELTESSSLSGTTKYHYMEISSLYPDTTYKYRIKSGATYYPAQTQEALTFTTLSRPSGEYLFSFAVVNDLRYAEGKTSTQSARGIPYEYCAQILSSEVSDINNHGVSFTVVNGNLTENNGTYGDQLGVNVKNRLELLNGASDLPSGQGYKYLPTTGYEDKTASYSTDWLTDGFIPLTSDPTSSESRYGYTAADKDSEAVFNYQFQYKYYNLIFLDSVKDTSGDSLVSLEAIYNYLSAESNSKTFVFMNYPAYNPLDDDTKDYPVSIPTSEVDGGLAVSNDEAFRATLESFVVSGESTKIVAGVITGHLGDNYKRDINGISYIRQAQAVGFPTGYSIYKVYSNGFIKTFYKTTGRDSSDKPYYEHARDQIVGQGILVKDVLTQVWLGSNSLRNFTKTYAFIPGIPPSISYTNPVSGETGVSLNSPIIVKFSKRMNSSNLNSWLNISPSVGTLTGTFLDADRKILKVNHSSDFVQGQTYTATLDATYVKDEGLTSLAADYTFTFDTTGGVQDTTPPSAEVTPLPDNVTTDPFPSFVGLATDESGVVNVEYRFGSSGSWTTCEALDGSFGGSIEAFKATSTSALSTGNQELWLRTTDGVGNVSSEGWLSYSFTVGGEKPSISITIDESTPYPGDSISSTPKVEITVLSVNSLTSGRITIASSQSALSFTNTDTNYYATHEVTTALSDGTYTITIEAFDSLGKASTYEATPLYIQTGGEVTIQDQPLNYPNPFNPGSQTTAIGYSLSKPAEITLCIFDLSGNMIFRNSYASGTDGGKAGYNEITWDGKSGSGAYVGNGIYIYLIIADGKVVKNGKGKITVFKQ